MKDKKLRKQTAKSIFDLWDSIGEIWKTFLELHDSRIRDLKRQRGDMEAFLQLTQSHLDLLHQLTRVGALTPQEFSDHVSNIREMIDNLREGIKERRSERNAV